MVFNFGGSRQCTLQVPGQCTQELSKSVGYLSPFPDTRGIMALVVLVSEHVSNGNMLVMVTLCCSMAAEMNSLKNQ